MLKLFRSRETKWVLSSLDELVSSDTALNNFEVTKVARERICSGMAKEGSSRGFSSIQVACIALNAAAKQVVLFGDNSFYYRGKFTSHGAEAAAVFRKSTELLVNMQMIDVEDARAILAEFESEVQATG